MRVRPTATTMHHESLGNPGLYRLLTWLSPSFPTGAFSYSHGLEAAVEIGAVRDRSSLEAWVAAILVHGSGRMDAAILCEAYRAALAGDETALAEVHRRGVAYRATAELALESGQQGAAFLAAYAAAWAAPHPLPLPASRERERPAPAAREGEGPPPAEVCHAAVFGAVAAPAGIALEDALVGYLQGFAGNLVSAGIRLGIVGQTDGQRILAALEPVVARAADAAIERKPHDFGAATFAADLASMAHEVQYSRLFRS